jgi:hypothetical protein
VLPSITASSTAIEALGLHRARRVRFSRLRNPVCGLRAPVATQRVTPHAGTEKIRRGGARLQEENAIAVVLDEVADEAVLKVTARPSVMRTPGALAGAHMVGALGTCRIGCRGSYAPQTPLRHHRLQAPAAKTVRRAPQCPAAPNSTTACCRSARRWRAPGRGCACVLGPPRKGSTLLYSRSELAPSAARNQFTRPGQHTPRPRPGPQRRPRAATPVPRG